MKYQENPNKPIIVYCILALYTYACYIVFILC